ncbi:MAG: N-formylglutamate amidohydrolase, partial [Thermaurantiacus sp.]
CAIYDGPLALEEAWRRLKQYYRPYHAALAAELEAARAGFGSCVLIDCHSMPSASARGADIVLGDRFGASCAPEITARAERLFRAEGFKVVRNRPYAGGFTTEYYGRPAENRHALQIEVNRALYMEERTLERSDGFDRLQVRLNRFMEGLMAAEAGIARAAE